LGWEWGYVYQDDKLLRGQTCIQYDCLLVELEEARTFSVWGTSFSVSWKGTWPD